MLDVPETIAGLSALATLRIPDLWQQEAVAALRAGRDAVVHAPTGAGKTLIFELWSHDGRPPGRAVYTVPTRALANDKLAEWRARGWNVGIATGDLADNLDAPILVATLETQKHRLIRGDGPRLLVVDEYQLIADADRGLNYELAIALAPPDTQLLLLSGSVHNPQQVVAWLRRLGRDAMLVRHDERPVPLEEVHANSLSWNLPAEVRGYWPRLVAKALAENLGPILIFAPRRRAAEQLAAELVRQLPNPNPLHLSPAQRQIVGEPVARLLKSRVAFHHSGLSYAARAGVIEPLAKAGQLRVVVATMGLAAGINFSLRSVALAGDSYRKDYAEQPLRADEVLQMFGRAGRRGIDEIGYVLVSNNEVRLRDGHPVQLARNGMVDWPALLGLMAAAADEGRDPFTVAVRAQERLFTTRPIMLGVEESLKHPDVPCGLKTDAERARHVRGRLKQFRNSAGEWEPLPPPREVSAGLVLVPRAVRDRVTEAAPDDGKPDLVPALTVQAALEKLGHGTLVSVGEGPAGRLYGRLVKVADVLTGDRVVLVKWLRRLTGWNGRLATMAEWEELIRPAAEEQLARQRTPVIRFERRQVHQLHAVLSLAHLPLRVPVDRHGVALWRAREREVPHAECVTCALNAACRQLATATGTAALWRRLDLVDAQGRPTRRGRLVSAFSGGDGLAIAAALEDESYPLGELVYDLANLDAGFRFCGDDNRWAGRLALACYAAYGPQNIPGYLENGMPPQYGAGAEEIVAAVRKDPNARHRWATDLLGAGDIDRAVIEWRSRLRQVAHAPRLDWPRWTAFQQLAAAVLDETESPTDTALPPLEPDQRQRMDHRLHFRRW